jgi:hypothetical protein
MTSKGEVESFLNQLKVKMRTFDVAFRPRDKNKQFLSEADILPLERLMYLKKLTFENYHSGPNKDNYDPGKPDYYEFGIEIKGIEVYIKISAGLPNKMIDCMSFHKAERAMTYPLR